jgi:hypothetical protein
MAGGLDAYYQILTKQFSAVTNTYTSGSGNEAVPSGAASVTISVYGNGGSGGTGFNGGIPGEQWGGGGGGGGGASISTYAIAASDWGTNLPYDVGASTVTGTINAGSISMNGGNGGDGGDADDTAGGSGGGGGTASGGNSSNTNGSSGNTGLNQAGGSGGAGVGDAGDGGNGGYPGAGSAGTTGRIVFAWT